MDKLLHAIAGAILFFIFALIIHWKTKDKFTSLIYSFAIVVFIAALKEILYDVYFGGEVEFMDWLSTVVGALMIMYIVGSNRKIKE